MNIFLSMLLVGGLVWLTLVYWERLVDADESFTQFLFWRWVGRGILLPTALWLILNAGVLPGLPPLLPELLFAQGAGAIPISLLLDLSGTAVFMIGSYWAMITFSWFLLGIVHKVPANQRKEVLWVGLIWLLLLLPLTGALAYAGGRWTIGLAATVALLPIVHFTLALLPGKEPAPSYGRAIAKMRFGKFNEAEWEVIQELERCSDDFDGWMMLAELYAVHYHDLASAEQTVRDLCSQENVSPSHFAVAFHRLADWHLKVGEDPVRARAALEAICERAPGTHLEKMARLRLNQIPTSREAFLQQKKGRKIYLPTTCDPFGPNTASPASPDAAQNATTLANQCVERLRQEPNDVAAREKLAHLLAEDLHQPDRALEQLNLLIGMPDQPEGKLAHWLSLAAAWHFRYRQDRQTTRLILERLVRNYPRSTQAFAAQRHLKLMEMEQQRARGKPDK